MQELNLMSFEGAPVRSLLIEGDPWWVASDVCAILGIVQPASSLRYLDDDEKGVRTLPTPGGPQEMAIVNEAGLYSLTLRSRKDEAKRFKRWVTHEVLPSIRKTGGYVAAGGPTLSQWENAGAIVGQLAQSLAAVQGISVEAKAIAEAASTKAEKAAADLEDVARRQAEYQAEHDKARIQTYARMFLDIKTQVVAAQLKRDPNANQRQLYMDFTNEMKRIAGVGSSAIAELTVSTAKKCLAAAQQIARRYGVPVTVQLPIAQEA